jgi:hypothetical protein
MPTGYTQAQLSHKTALTIDNAGNTWVGFNQHVGLGKFDGTNWTMFDTTNTPMTSATVTALATQAGTTIWVATSTSQVTGELFSYNGSTWIDHTISVNFNYVNVLAADNATGVIWVGTKAGLFRGNGSAWTNLTVANSGLASDTILSLAIDPSGNLLAGTQRGLSVQNGTGWTNYSSSNIGFTSNIVNAIYSDATNGTWLSLNGHVGRFSPPYFVPMDSIMLTPVPNAYGSNTISITRGPNGGVIFNGSNGTLIEVISNHPQFYYTGFVYISAMLAYNPVNGKTWIANRLPTSSGIPLFAFDGNYTHHLGEGVYGVTPNNCRYLDVNNVRTAILNRGDKNWNLSNAQYEVPKGSGAHTVFTSSLWIGGLDNGGGLHQAAMTYRQTGMDFFPGPLDTINGTTDSATAVQYDYIWRIEKLKIQEFQYYWGTGAVQNGTYIPDQDILTWPAHGTGNYTRNMAPFIDVDGNGIYNPVTGGDYPDIKGDEMLYCIYNDNLAAHTETGGAPFKVEVHASAYAYFCPAIADSQKVINYTTYYNYEIFNRSSNNYNNAYIGAFHDVDLGTFDDDYVGCISTENFSFTYNNDSDATYGAHPPISSVAILNGPMADPVDGIDNDNDGTTDEAGEINLMTGHVFYNNDFSVTGNPEHADDFYMYMSGKWKDSTDITIGGNGYGGVTPTNFMFDGLPYDTAAWTEISANNAPYDRRSVTSCGPFTLNGGEHVNFNYAIVFSRDTTLGPPDTAYYDQAVNDVRRVRNWYNTSTTPSCVQWGVGINEPVPAISALSLYPNPASTLLTIEYKAESKNARYEVLDMTGRSIETGAIIQGGQTTISVEALPFGIYLVRVIDNENVTARKFIRQ